MICQFNIEYTDNTRLSVGSDTTWKIMRTDQLLPNNEYDGEEYDARKGNARLESTGFRRF